MSNKTEDFNFNDFNDNTSEDTIELADVFAIVWQNRFWFVLSVSIALVLGFIYVRSTPKTYSRTATILIKDEKANGGMMSEAAAFQDIFSFGSNSVNNEIGILMSRHLMIRVAEKLKLETNYQIKSGLRYNDLYTSSPIEIDYIDDLSKNGIFMLEITPLGGNQARLDYVIVEVDANDKEKEIEISTDIEFGQSFTTLLGEMKVSPTIFYSDDYVGKTIFVSKNELKETAKYYMTKLSLENPDAKSTLVNINIKDVNISRAEDIINTLISVYETNAIDDKNKIVASTLSFINNKVDVLDNDLNMIDSSIEEYKKENQLTDVTSVSSMYLQNYSKLDAEALALENQLGIAKFMKEYLQDNKNQEELIPGNIGIDNSGIVNQINSYNESMTLRNKLIANSSINNPLVREIQSTLVSMRTSILNSINNLIASLNIQIAKYALEEEKSSSKIANVSSQHKYMINIERQLKIKEELYLYLLKKQEESEIQLTTTESNCIVVDFADGPKDPISPSKMKIVLICFVLGLAFPVGILYIKNLLDTSVKSQKDIKGATDVPFIGEIPLNKSKEDKSFVVEDGNRDVINEAFRLLRDNIKMMSANDAGKGQVILITSFNPNTGKTFITSNFAASMSLSSSKIIVLDIDLRKGSLTKRLGYGSRQPGLSTYLSGKNVGSKDIISKYKDSNFDFITSGELPPNPAELLGSDKFGKLIEELREAYDYIIFDTAPYGLVVDTALCAKFADMSAVVVRSGLFDKRQIPYLTEVYRSAKLPNMCILLNGVDVDSVDYGHGYGYGYAYGYGYGYGNKVKKDFKYYRKKILGV